MVSKEDIRRWTGLHHKTIDKMISLLEKKGIDWEEVIDWYTVGQEAREFGDIEKEVWRKLAAEYGISKPIIEKGLGRELEEMEEKEIEYLLSSKEGVKQLLTRIYKNGLKPKEREILKEKILNRPDLATLIALYNGEAQEYAKRYLTEMVIAKPVDPEQLRMGIKVEMEHTDNPQVAEKIARDHLMEIPDYYTRLIKMEEEAIKIETKPRLKPVEPVKEIAPKKEEKPVMDIIKPSEGKIEELSTTYSYIEVAQIAKDNNIRVSGSKIEILSELMRIGVL